MWWLIVIICTASQIQGMAATQNPRVCVIGAGVGGLSLAKHLKEENVNFDVLEMTKYVGGTWRYEERVGTDENNLPIHTSMYKHLRTNLPKATMEISGFPIPETYPSYPSWDKYYEYIKSYVKHFDLEKYIKFSHRVVSVKRVNNAWKVKHEHIISNEVFEDIYDYVIVATGHHSKPNYPNIPGEDIFKGTIIHSHDYREPAPYKCRRVLIVGAGPSARDISLDIAEISLTLVHSHHSKINFRTPYPPNYIIKPNVKEFNETGAIFEDGTYEDLDDVIYCTGFQYDFPFLDESSELSVASRSVTPLYKYMVNINQPSLIFIGLIVRACLVIAIDAQARYATALIKGNFILPTHEEMLNVWQKQADSLRSSGRPLSHIHWLGEKEDQYYEELSKESGIVRVPPVMFKIRNTDITAKLENLYTYRDYSYKVIDSETFIRSRDLETVPKKIAVQNCD